MMQSKLRLWFDLVYTSCLMDSLDASPGNPSTSFGSVVNVDESKLDFNITYKSL